MKSAPTPLETDLLTHFHVRYGQLGFPAPGSMRVEFRESSSAGRFTYLKHEGCVQLPDGHLGLGQYSQFDMPGREAGFSFWVQLAHGKVQYLEIVVNGGEAWDGSESGWIVLDPDTGDLPTKQADV